MGSHSTQIAERRSGQRTLTLARTVALPGQVTDILDLIQTVSNWMFALFLTGACLSFLMIFIVPLAVYSRWAGLPIAILTFLCALFTTVRPLPPPFPTHPAPR